jgi:phosphopantothenoylcysteine decarboxylase/phosphopantothenate--cysteine ligase
MRPVEGRRILLGVTGGIASYKTVMLARLLAQAGAEVDVVMTRGALEFIGAITFEAVTGRRAYSEIFGSGNALDHIKLAREAELFVVAPATADFLARAAHGHADDLLTACLLANTSPVLLMPAMNDRMWANAQTRRNVAHLRELGYEVLDPDEGPLAVGEGSGPGRMPEPERIFEEISKTFSGKASLAGKKFVVTAGATREAIDPVRFISNHSSGKMGVAIARAAHRRGADVTLIAGHLEVPAAEGVRKMDVVSVSDMRNAVEAALENADALVMAAAPADFRPSAPAAQKIKKSGKAITIDLEPAEDILSSTIHARNNGAIIVGFALETQDLLANAKSKLDKKKLDMIVANDATEAGSGFSVDTNRVTLIMRDGSTEDVPLMKKTELAELIVDRIETMLNGRSR